MQGLFHQFLRGAA